MSLSLILLLVLEFPCFIASPFFAVVVVSVVPAFLGAVTVALVVVLVLTLA